MTDIFAQTAVLFLFYGSNSEKEVFENYLQLIKKHYLEKRNA